MLIRERGISKFPIVFPISGSKIEYESAEDEIKESSLDENMKKALVPTEKIKIKTVLFLLKTLLM